MAPYNSNNIAAIKEANKDTITNCTQLKSSRLVYFHLVLPLVSTGPDCFRAGDKKKCLMAIGQMGFI